MALRSFTGSGIRIKGGRGGASLPQAGRRRRRRAMRIDHWSLTIDHFPPEFVIGRWSIVNRHFQRNSQDVAAEVLVLHDSGEHFLDVACVNSDRLLLELAASNGGVVDALLHDGTHAGARALLAGLPRRRA